jgi:hypothetical protein
MASSIQPKRRAKKKINGLPNDLFTRLQFVIAFDDYPPQLSDMSPSLMDSYSPQVLGSCTQAWRLPKNALDVSEYRRCIILPGQAPYYNPPPLPSPLPPGSSNSFITKPIHPSILPLLLTALHARVDVRQYHIVSERNSFRKLAMNDEDFVITVTRFDSTLLLRRYAAYNRIDRNDPGYRFEQMCTTNDGYYDGNYQQLIEGQIGELRTLMLGETDSIRRENRDSVELKCQRRDLAKSMEHDWWSQVFLSK